MMDINNNSEDLSSSKMKKKVKSVRKMPEEFLKRESIEEVDDLINSNSSVKYDRKARNEKA